MFRTILIYGVALAVLIFVLKFIEYRFLVRDLSLEFYLGVVAVLFTVVGIWTGNRLTRKKIAPGSDTPFEIDEQTLRSFGISKREHEVLALMALGFSNQEIADKLFVSLNTVKTHSSNLFLKLDVKRRTQAIQRAKELRLIP
ncbi:MAG: LuxR C-terminal-related transcriptional regulator [Cyclobacteriaceae bacterium]